MAALGIVVDSIDLIDKVNELMVPGLNTLGLFLTNGNTDISNNTGKVLIWQCDDFAVLTEQQTILNNNGYITSIGHSAQEICGHLFPEDKEES